MKIKCPECSGCGRVTADPTPYGLGFLAEMRRVFCPLCCGWGWVTKSAGYRPCEPPEYTPRWARAWAIAHRRFVR